MNKAKSASLLWPLMRCNWAVLRKQNATEWTGLGIQVARAGFRTEKGDIAASSWALLRNAERKEALRAVAALQQEINAAERLRKFRPITFADLVAHYRQRELDGSGSWKSHATKGTYGAHELWAG